MLRVVGWVAGIIAIIAVLWLALHVFLRPVNPAQEQPSKHLPGPCWACHFVTDSAKLVEIEE